MTSNFNFSGYKKAMRDVRGGGVGMLAHLLPSCKVEGEPAFVFIVFHRDIVKLQKICWDLKAPLSFIKRDKFEKYDYFYIVLTQRYAKLFFKFFKGEELFGVDKIIPEL